MDGWMDGWMDRWMGGWMAKWVNKCDMNSTELGFIPGILRL